MDRDETKQPESNLDELEDLPEKTDVEAAEKIKGGSGDDWQLLASKPQVTRNGASSTTVDGVIAVSHS